MGSHAAAVIGWQYRHSHWRTSDMEAALAAFVVLPVALLIAVGGLHWRLSSYNRHKGLETTPLGPWGILRYYAIELQAVCCLAWWQLRAAFRDSLRTPAGANKPTVVCVHGHSGSGSNFWRLRQELERDGRPTLAVALGKPPRRLDSYAAPLVAALGDIEGPIDVVCHSMGGVILRIALQNRPDLASSIRRIVTLGSPHQGTASARGIPLSRHGHPLGRRALIRRNLPDFRTLAPRADVTTVAAVHDLLVYPSSTSHLPGATHFNLSSLGHCGLLTHPSAIHLVKKALQ